MVLVEPGEYVRAKSRGEGDQLRYVLGRHGSGTVVSGGVALAATEMEVVDVSQSIVAEDVADRIDRALMGSEYMGCEVLAE